MTGATSGKFNWTDKAVEDVKARWARGESAGWIASEMRGPSRSAVIGKLHRLGLLGNKIQRVRTPRSDDVLGRKIQRRRIRKVAGLDQGIKFTPPPVADGEPIGPHINLMLLEKGRCRWPFGDPTSDAFGFCGHTTHGPRYCAHHAGRSAGVCRIAPPIKPAAGYVCRPMGVSIERPDNTLKSLNF